MLSVRVLVLRCCQMRVATPQTFAAKLHSPGSPSRTSALLRLPNPSLGILKSVTSLDIYRFIAFMPGCAPKVKPAFSSSFPKLRHLTSVTHLTF